jgi:hypothetical protein
MTLHSIRWTMRALLLIVTASVAAALLASPQAFADATDEYPIPSKQIETQCDAEQYLAAARDTSPVYFERYMLDKSNRPLDVQHTAVQVGELQRGEFSPAGARVGGEADQRRSCSASRRS